jgi:mono/diheme cytochrome c family protein
MPSKDRVRIQVTNGGATMPSFRNRLSSSQINSVATYVSTVAGK